MATITRRQITQSEVQVALPEIAGTHWETPEFDTSGVPTALQLRVDSDGSVVGTIMRTKKLLLDGHNTPGFTFFTACDAFRDAFRAMKDAGIW